MGKTKIRNTNALIDFFARNRDHAERCACSTCAQALTTYKKFYLGSGDRRTAMTSAQAVVDKHGWR